MSGHSHAKTVKRTKEAEDKKKSQIFSKMARLISIAAKQGGTNPETNPKLRMAVETARSANMPKDNIERAVKKGSGEYLSDENLEEITVESFGPGGAAIIIEIITENKNRSLAEIKQILSSFGAKLVNEGGARWMFERKISQENNNLEWLPKQKMEATKKDKESCQKLFKSLEELDSVQKVYSNLKL